MSFNFSKNNNSLITRPKPVLNMKIPPNQINFNLSSKSKKSDADESSSGQTPLSIPLQRRALPIFKVKRRILSEVEKHQTLILIGETGCGKTTQIPQYIHELNLEGNGVIAITQPRRIAAITVASRVALEINTTVGQTVGYCVRFEDATSPQTKLKYMTDGMLLREAMADGLLASYSVIILDEAHERTIHTDVLFGVVKGIQKKRINMKLRPLKIIVMSATMDVDHFSNYFDNAPVVYLEGRQHSVQVFNAVEPQEDYNFSCLVTIFQIHKEAPHNHDILVFLTGQEEIEAMAANIRSISKDSNCAGPPVRVYPLYASMASSKQLEVFQPPPPKARRIILSTNIAETSITISGIKYVIDSGKVKIRMYNSGTGFETLKVQQISQAQAWQRTGRAGRESEGICYRSYTHSEFEEMEKNTLPEIQRCNLASVLLQLLALGVNALSFDFMDKPPKQTILDGYEQLKLLGAIDNVESLQLTELGKKMALFPLDPRFSKIILCSPNFGCVEEVLNVIALLSGESVFVNNPSKREEAAAAHAKFFCSAGDHVTLLNILKTYNSMASKHAWCYEHFFNARNLEYALKVKKQLAEICRRCNVTMSSCGQDMEKLCRCLLTGLFMNVAELQRDRKYVALSSRQIVNIHPTSVLHGSLPPLVLFTELVHTGKTYMRYLTPVDGQWLIEAVPSNFKLNRLPQTE